MAQETKEEPKLGISPAQVAGSALAAVSGAVLASFAGVTGTIIGAAVGSIVATVGAAIYTWWLRRTTEAVRRRAAQVRKAALLTSQLPRTVTQGPMRSRHKGAEPTPAEQAAAESDADADEGSVRKALPWGKLVIASVGVTVLALGGITAFEAVTGQPVSSLVGGNDTKGTTVGNVVRKEEPSPKKQQPAEQEDKSPSDKSSQDSDTEEDAEQDPGGDEQPSQPDTSTDPQPEPTKPTDPLEQPQPSTGPEGAPAAEPSQAP